VKILVSERGGISISSSSSIPVSYSTAGREKQGSLGSFPALGQGEEGGLTEEGGAFAPEDGEGGPADDQVVRGAAGGAVCGDAAGVLHQLLGLAAGEGGKFPGEGHPLAIKG